MLFINTNITSKELKHDILKTNKELSKICTKYDKHQLDKKVFIKFSTQSGSFLYLSKSNNNIYASLIYSSNPIDTLSIFKYSLKLYSEYYFYPHCKKLRNKFLSIIGNSTLLKYSKLYCSNKALKNITFRKEKRRT